jgi:hypothetical protein
MQTIPKNHLKLLDLGMAECLLVWDIMVAKTLINGQRYKHLFLTWSHGASACHDGCLFLLERRLQRMIGTEVL